MPLLRDNAGGARKRQGRKKRKKNVLEGLSPGHLHVELCYNIIILLCVLHYRSGSSVYLWQTAKITSLKSGEGTEDGLHVSKESLSVVSESI